MSVLVLLAVLLCFMIAAWSWITQHLSDIPDVPGALPIIGHSIQVIGDRKHLWNFVKGSQVYSLEKGGVAKFWIGTHSFYVITDPEDSLTVANTCINKSYLYDFAKDFLNNGLVLAEASIWKTHRKLLNPAFNQQVLNTYVNEMNVQSRKLVTQLASKVEKGPFDVRDFLVSFTLSTVTRTSLGLNTQDQANIDSDYAESLEDLLGLFCDRFQKVWLHLSYVFNRSAMKRRQTILIKKLKDIIDSVVRKRKSELKTNNKDIIMHGDSTPGKFKPVLDQMLHLAEEHGAFTDEDIKQNLNNLVAAAYDSTSSAMTFILINIGSKVDVQNRIFNELQEVLGHEDGDFTKHDLSKLVYLEAVIKETMRMYPVIPLIARKVEKDVKLKNYTLRAGNTCMIGIHGLLRHPLWGADVNEFRPERWLNLATLPVHPGLHAVFSIGKRNCIGKQYSLMAMKIALAHILRRYRVSGDINNVISQFDVILKPVIGHHIQLIPRT